MSTSISGVILAGGESKRFGGITKARILIGGKSIISRMLEVIDDIFDEIVIVANNPAEFSEFDHYTITSDQFLNAGPLGGIQAAMRSSSKDAVFVFAGDMPFLDKDLIIRQINSFIEMKPYALVPQIGKYSEPLHSIYSNSLLDKLEEYLAEPGRRAVRDFYNRIDVSYLKMDPSDISVRSFTNINSPSDLNDISSFTGI
jgi:molybdopterin-guanine dinucleotide biosynthesis protein A